MCDRLPEKTLGIEDDLLGGSYPSNPNQITEDIIDRSTDMIISTNMSEDLDQEVLGDGILWKRRGWLESYFEDFGT